MKKLILIALLSWGCKKTEPLPEPSVLDSSFGLIQEKILNRSCATPSCHASASDASFKQHGLVLKGDKVYDDLHGGVKNKDAADAGLVMIDHAGNLEKSFFFQKIDFKNAKYKFGSSMPLGADALNANKIEFIKQWIAAGAPKMGHIADKKLLD